MADSAWSSSAMLTTLQNYAEVAQSFTKQEIKQVSSLVSELSLKEVLDRPVDPGLLGPLFFMSAFSVCLFLMGTSYCLRSSRDSNIALNSKAL